MSHIIIVIIAYFIDKVFGNFQRFRHPAEYIKDIVNFYEDRYYKDTLIHGFGLVVFVLFSIGIVALVIEEFISYFIPLLTILISALIASLFINNKLLHKTASYILIADDKEKALCALAQKEIEGLDESDIYKAAIELFVLRLHKEFIAPLLYLLFFGLPGILLYKTISIMDSMVGHKNKRYKKFGKASAILNDVTNYIPARITALLIMMMAKQKKLFAFYKDGKQDESPNSGHIITAIALALGVSLGGKRNYSQKRKKAIYFGKGRKKITQEDLKTALQIGKF